MDKSIIPIRFNFMVGKPERPRRRWMDNIRMDLGEVGIE
jgi:hypothetical protein